MVASGQSSYSSFDPSAAVNLKIADNIRAYARYATAYRSGGFSIYAGSSAFAPENLTSYEIGLKALFWDRRIQFDVAAFRKRTLVLQAEAAVLAYMEGLA